MYVVIDAPPGFDLEKLGKLLGSEYGYNIIQPPRSDEENPGERILQMIGQVLSREPDEDTVALVSKEGILLTAKEMKRSGELPLDDYRAIETICGSAGAVEPDMHIVILDRDNRIYEEFCEESPGVFRVYAESSPTSELAAGIDRLITRQKTK